MSRRVYYVAHPLGAPNAAGLQANLAAAMRWLSWLRRSFPAVTFVAPWIASVIAGDDDTDPAQREAGIVDAEAVIERCDGIVLVGGRVSAGMRRELEHGIQRVAFEVFDLKGIVAEPPATMYADADGWAPEGWR